MLRSICRFGASPLRSGAWLINAWLIGPSLVSAWLTSACSDPSESPAGSDSNPSAELDAGQGAQPLLPWGPGLSWVYRVTDAQAGVSEKTTTIGTEPEPVGRGPHADVMAYRVVTKKSDGVDQSISWQEPLDDTVVRYREQSYSAKDGALVLEEFWDPYKLHADGSAAHTARGARWIEHYTETKVSISEGMEAAPESLEREDNWQVVSAESDGVSVTVPAGTFDHVLVVQKAGPSGSKTYWYARGIGKLKETGSQTEELVRFSGEP